MSRKNRRKKHQRKKPPAPAKFSVGTAVRVKPGTRDPDFADIPLGGWAGTIREIEQRESPPTYLVEWNQRTLDQMHPVYRKRCQRDELDLKSVWLGEDDLEPDTGEPTEIEQPTCLISRPLSKSDPDDRIRAIFALTSDDPVPNVTSETQAQYHRHLATHLAFPFPALYPVETDPFDVRNSQVTVLGLLDADEGDDDTGLLCEAVVQGETAELPLADLEGVINAHNRQLIEDYAYWFHNWEGDEGDEWAALPEVPFDSLAAPFVKRIFLKMLVEFGLYGAIGGVVLGSLVGALESAQIGALVGALIVGFLGYWAGAKNRRLFGLMNRGKSGSFVGGLFGALAGGILGSLVGAMAVAFLGTLAGGVLGGLAGKLVAKPLGKPGASAWGVLLGAGIGAIGWAFYQDPEGASAGALQGAWMGAVAGVLLPLVFLGTLFLVARHGGYLEG